MFRWRWAEVAAGGHGEGFLIFGKAADAFIKLVLALCIIEHFTGVFKKVFGGWVFDPLFADKDELFRAIEIAGYIGIMLAGTFPICYLFQRYCRKPMHFIGRKLGLSDTGALGFIMVLANIIAVYHLFKGMRARDKVLCVAFGICAQATLGDHLAFTANFQPSLVLPIMMGKFLGGMIAVLIAIKIRCRKPNCWKKNRRKGSRRPSPPPLAEFSLSHKNKRAPPHGKLRPFSPRISIIERANGNEKDILACPTATPTPTSCSNALSPATRSPPLSCAPEAPFLARSACRIRSTCVCKNSTKPPSASCGRRSTPCSWRRWMS